MSLISDGESGSHLRKETVLHRFRSHYLARIRLRESGSALAIIYSKSERPSYEQHLSTLREAKSVSASVATILSMKETQTQLAILCEDGVTLAEQLEMDIEANGLALMPLEDAVSMAEEMLKVVCDLHKVGIYGLTLLAQSIVISGGNSFFKFLDFSEAIRFQPDQSQSPLSQNQRMWVKDIHRLGRLLFSLSLKEVNPRDFDGVTEMEMKEIVKKETMEIGEIWGEFLIKCMRDQPMSARRLYEELKNKIGPALSHPDGLEMKSVRVNESRASVNLPRPSVILPRPSATLDQSSGLSNVFPRDRSQSPNPFPSPIPVNSSSSFPQLASLLCAAREWIAHGQLSFAERKIETFLRTLNTLPSVEIRVSLNQVNFRCGICNRNKHGKAEIWTLVCLHNVCTECLKNAVQDRKPKSCPACKETLELQEQEVDRMEPKLRTSYTLYSWELL